jgi:hypothetical protein
MKRGLSANRWVIISGDGLLYEGQWMRRVDAISAHLFALKEGMPQFAIRTGLTRSQKIEWEKCKRRGDRAVLATITWDNAQ